MVAQRKPGFSRNKGARGERAFFKALKELLPEGSKIGEQLKRNLVQYQSGKESDRLLKLRHGNLAIEVKCRAKGFGLEKQWLKQAFLAAAQAKALPVVVVKYDYKPYQVFIPVIGLSPLFSSPPINLSIDEWEAFIYHMAHNPEPSMYHMACIDLECLATLIQLADDGGADV